MSEYDKTIIDHIRTADKSGDGNRLATADTGDSLTTSVPLIYDADGNIISTATRTGNTTNFATATAGSKTSGFYPKWDSSGNLTDGDGGGSGTVSLLRLICDWFADNNSEPFDALLTDGEYRIFVNRVFRTTSDWLAPTNAKMTVATGKKLVCLFCLPDRTIQQDGANRSIRLLNTTDTVEVIAANELVVPAFQDENADSSAGTKFPEVVAGKAVELQTWNQTGASRRMGGLLICKEISA